MCKQSSPIYDQRRPWLQLSSAMRRLWANTSYAPAGEGVFLSHSCRHHAPANRRYLLPLAGCTNRPATCLLNLPSNLSLLHLPSMTPLLLYHFSRTPRKQYTWDLRYQLWSIWVTNSDCALYIRQESLCHKRFSVTYAQPSSAVNPGLVLEGTVLDPPNSFMNLI